MERSSASEGTPRVSVVKEPFSRDNDQIIGPAAGPSRSSHFPSNLASTSLADPLFATEDRDDESVSFHRWNVVACFCARRISFVGGAASPGYRRRGSRGDGARASGPLDKATDHP